MSDPLTEVETVRDNNEVYAVENNSAVASSEAKLPQKRFFRQRAHANPFSDHLLE